MYCVLSTGIVQIVEKFQLKFLSNSIFLNSNVLIVFLLILYVTDFLFRHLNKYLSVRR